MRIGIANDMPLAVQAIRKALAQNEAHSIAWTAPNGAEAVALCRQELPDLILMDLLMPEVDGVEAVRRIMAATPCPILIVTSDVERNMSLVFRAMGHGAVDVVMTPTMGGSHAADAKLRPNSAGWSSAISTVSASHQHSHSSSILGSTHVGGSLQLAAQREAAASARAEA